MDKLSTNVRKNISPSVAYLSLAGGDEDVHCVDLVKLKVELVVLLPLRLRWVLNNGKRFVVLHSGSLSNSRNNRVGNVETPCLNNGLLAIDVVLLQLVGKHALNRLAVVRLCDLLNCVCDRIGLKERKKPQLTLIDFVKL